jgi:hypothetical protein
MPTLLPWLEWSSLPLGVGCEHRPRFVPGLHRQNAPGSARNMMDCDCSMYGVSTSEEAVMSVVDKSRWMIFFPD